MDATCRPMVDLNDKVENTGLTQTCSEVLQISSGAQHSQNPEPDIKEVVVKFLLRTEHFGENAEFPGEAGVASEDGSLVDCTCCGKAEIQKKTLICDVCGQSYHLKCVKLRENQASDFDEWVCAACAMKQEKHRWALGRIDPSQLTNIYKFTDSVQETEERNRHCLMDRELKPKSDGRPVVTKHVTSIDGGLSADKVLKRVKDDDFDPSTVGSRKPFGSSREELKSRTTRLKSLCRSKDSGRVTTAHGHGIEGEDEMVNEASDSSGTSITTSSKDVDDEFESSTKEINAGMIGQQHLQKLKEFIMQKGGTINEDWRVEVKKRIHSEKTFDITFFSSDGLKFRSRLEVARYLGLLEQKPDTNSRDLSTPASRRKRKGSEHFSEDLEQNDEHLGESMKRQKAESCSQSESQDPVMDIGLELPYQCMDLRIESLGTVEMRPEYYNDEFLWPIGYRCLWHDGVTGSICISEVLDGEPLHPTFRVTRKSCLGYLDIPANEISEIQGESTRQESIREEKGLKVEKKQYARSYHVYNEDDELNLLVGNLLEFYEQDVAISQDCNFWLEKHENITYDNIGEIVVESSSSYGAWKLLAERILDSITEVSYMGKYNIGCRHVGNFLKSSLEGNFPVCMGEFNKGELDIEKYYAKLLAWLGHDRFGFDVPIIQKHFEAKKAKLLSVRPPPPKGWPVFQHVSAKYAGDILQIWEFLCRFSDILGQKEPLSLDDLEEIVTGTSEMDTDISTNRKAQCVGEHRLLSERHSRSKHFSPNSRCNIALAGSNIALLKIALSDLQQVALTIGPELALDAKRSKKKDGEGVLPGKKLTASLVTLNEFTWPEVARRYVIGLLALKSCGENIDMSIQERRKILHCIQGDGGALCGALAGVAAIEADAQLLATAEKQLSRWIHNEYEKDTLEASSNDFSGGKAAESMMLEGVSGKPPWAVVLEPVRKLATNVGARIRNCVREALDMNPPEWAKEILEWSISKEVYKGNASGPTKRAVLSVLEKAVNEAPVIPPVVEKIQYVSPTAAVVMRRCRVVLRQLITSEDVRTFCNSLGGTVLGYFEDEEDSIEMLLPLVTRPLDFRIIDSRLAAGAYGDSHESFAADMRQLFQNVPIVFHDREDLAKVGEDLSQQFERLYEERVVKLVSGQEEVIELIQENDAAGVMKSGLDEELMKAPWEEGVCKICGIDKDDDSTLLCDQCDAEYHIYCLIPPLSMIPEGNWYCPSCVAREKNDCTIAGTSMIQVTPGVSCQQNKLVGDEAILPSLAESMSGKDYWQLSILERVQLLKFLCDKVLESTYIRDHIDQSVELIPELQQKLRLLLMERQMLASKGVNRLDEMPAPDNVENISREVLMPKKRGRKSFKASTPYSLMSDTTRSEVGETTMNEVGMELKKVSAEYSHFSETDGAVVIEEKIDGRTRLIGHTPAHARNGEAGKVAPVTVSSQPAKEQVGTKFSSEKNGNFDDLKAVNLPGGHSVGVTDVSAPSTIGSCISIDLTNRSSEISRDLGYRKQAENNLSPVYTQDGHDGPQKNASVAPIQSGADLLEAEIYRVESELNKMAPRREFLGRDALGRNYWALGWVGKVPWLVVEAMPQTSLTHAEGESAEATQSMVNAETEWYAYCNDQSLEQLIKWLKPTIASERMLKVTLTKWCLSWSHKYRKEMGTQYYLKSKSLTSASLNTKAVTILSKIFGPVPQPEASNEMSVRKRGRKRKSVSEGVIRCDCLELVLPTRIHCPCCHHSYETISELESHNNGACSWTGLEDEGQILTMSKKKVKVKGQDFSSRDLHLIVKRFTLHTSNRERISQIGCLGDKGPKFVPALTVSPLLDPALHLASLYDNLLCDITNNSGARHWSAGEFRKANEKLSLVFSSNDLTHLKQQQSISSLHDFGQVNTDTGKSTRTGPPDQDDSIQKSIVPDQDRESDVPIETICQGLAWKRPPAKSLDQSDMWAFKKLKASLLDMECILTSDIMEPSRSEPNRRRAWRSFVKSASSILELVQSLILLEQMIKPNSLRETWCYWTSLSAGVGINTISSLALRIYSLDAAIKYKRLAHDGIDTEDTGKANKSMKKKKIQG